MQLNYAITAASINYALSPTGTQLAIGGHLFAGSIYNIGWASRSLLSSPSDGTIRATNAAGTSFTMFQFGGGTSSFIGLKPSAQTLLVRLADDSAYTGLAAQFLRPVQTTVAGLPAAAAVGQGAMCSVTDANATTPRSVVAGGGANKAMVWSDGTNWLIF